MPIIGSYISVKTLLKEQCGQSAHIKRVLFQIGKKTACRLPAGIRIVKAEDRKILRDPNIMLCAKLAEPKGGISVGGYGSGEGTVPEPLQKSFLHLGGGFCKEEVFVRNTSQPMICHSVQIAVISLASDLFLVRDACNEGDAFVAQGEEMRNTQLATLCVVAGDGHTVNTWKGTVYKNQRIFV